MQTNRLWSQIHRPFEGIAMTRWAESTRPKVVNESKKHRHTPFECHGCPVATLAWRRILLSVWPGNLKWGTCLDTVRIWAGSGSELHRKSVVTWSTGREILWVLLKTQIQMQLDASTNLRGQRSSTSCIVVCKWVNEREKTHFCMSTHAKLSTAKQRSQQSQQKRNSTHLLPLSSPRLNLLWSQNGPHKCQNCAGVRALKTKRLLLLRDCNTEKGPLWEENDTMSCIKCIWNLVCSNCYLDMNLIVVFQLSASDSDHQEYEHIPKLTFKEFLVLYSDVWSETFMLKHGYRTHVTVAYRVWILQGQRLHFSINLVVALWIPRCLHSGQ